MNVLKSHLVLYFIFGTLFFLSVFMDWTYISYIAKPLFIGAISFYYIEQSKRPINYYNCVVLLLLFMSGIINLLEGYGYFLYVLLFNFLAYCILLFQLIRELIDKRLYKINQENFMSILLTFIFLSCLLYISLAIVFDSTFEFHEIILIYDITLISFAFFAAFAYVTKLNPKNTYLILYALDVLVCELFYGIYHYYYKLPFFRFTSVFCYILSFYFLIHYFLKEKEDQIEE